MTRLTQRGAVNTTVLYVTTIIIAIAVAFATSWFAQDAKQQRAAPNLKAEVLQRGKLRCAYVVYAPGVIKDPNTGELSGIAVDVIHKIGEKLGLEIEWIEEAAWGTMIEGLHTKRYDVVVGMIWPTASRAKRVEFTNPMWYSVAGLYARSGDTRFTDPTAINDAKVRISVIDGEISTLIAQARYPKATLVTLPQTADISQMMLNVVNDKADLTIVTPYQANRFIKAHPGSLQTVVLNRPLRYSANTLLVPENEAAFKAMINTTLEELINTGELDDILTQYEPQPHSFYRVALPYRTTH